MSWILKNKLIFGFFLAGFILINLGFFCSFLKFKNLSDALILEYVNPIGIIFVGNFYYLLYFEINGIIISLINFILVKKINSRDVFFAKFFAIFNFFINLLIFIYFLTIINVN